MTTTSSFMSTFLTLAFSLALLLTCVVLIATSLCVLSKTHPRGSTAGSHPWDSLVAALVDVTSKPYDRLLVPLSWGHCAKGWRLEAADEPGSGSAFEAPRTSE